MILVLKKRHLILLLFYINSFIIISCNQPNPDEYPVRGIDISNHQKKMNWIELKKENIQFVYIKASEGADLKDQKFSTHWNETIKAKLIPGAYHYFTFCTSGLKQAEFFLAHTPPSQGALPYAVDVEYGGNCKNRPSSSEISQELNIFIQKVEKSTQRRMVIYTTLTAYYDFIRKQNLDNPIWIRNTWMHPVLPGNHLWKIWQYKVSPLSGSQGPIDQNVFNGDLEEFRNWVYQESWLKHKKD